MALILTETQLMLEDAVQRSCTRPQGAALTRKLREDDSGTGVCRQRWREIAAMGLTGVLVRETDGGLGLGHVEAGIILAGLGFALDPSPFLSTAVGGALALRDAPEAAREAWLPGIVEGRVICAVAVDEAASHRPDAIACQASLQGGKIVLNGSKAHVRHATSADLLVVAARREDGTIALFGVPPIADGVVLTSHRLVDGSVASDLSFENVRLDEAGIFGGADSFGEVMDALRVGTAAEQFGVARAAADMTNQYLKDRKQFGVHIGSFQALQHRSAQVYCELEVAGAAIMKAQQLLDARAPEASIMTSAAKAMADTAATLAVQESVQMHGGVGMTDELDVGLLMKRAKVLSHAFGSADFHAARLAELEGY